MQALSPNIRGFIFDIDGTLLDSNDAHAKSWQLALESVDRKLNLRDVRRAIGMGGDQLLPVLIQASEDSKIGREATRLKTKIFNARYRENLKPLPGARDLVHHLKKMGYRLAVASSASESDIRYFLGVMEIANEFEVIVSGADAKASKPDPSSLKIAAEKLGISPVELIMVGDTPYDLEAARGAGIPMIAFRSGGWSDADLKQAVEIFDGPEDLLKNILSRQSVDENALR